jgi:hypothetical protein
MPQYEQVLVVKIVMSLAILYSLLDVNFDVFI